MTCMLPRRSGNAGVLGLSLAAALALAGCGGSGGAGSGDDGSDQDWALHGHTADAARFSSMSTINDENVGKLGLAWSFKIDPDHGMESTPIVTDGTMYVTGPYSIVYALDAVTGREIWRYDPEVDRGISNRGCCGPNNRGVAVSGGKVFVGAFDGRLVALDAKTGKVAWSANTLVDANRNYTITGAPVVAGNVVVIGNGGAEYGVRGYVTAYDLKTGKEAWRFFTVPGAAGSDGDSRAMRLARPTWFGAAYAEQGGGGTVWDSMVYDAELDLLYLGVGNGSLWSRKLRSDGKGDNLFLSSIVAVRPKTGEYVWHYQTTPGDEWDYTATQNMIMATLLIDGRNRKVIMQAPKNGFFYVIDRTDGKLISAKNFVPVTWAKGVDPKTGRPLIDEAAARYEDGKVKVVAPESIGAHNWQPMSFDPLTGLVYIPAQITAGFYKALPQAPMSKHLGTMNVGAFVGVAPIAAAGTTEPFKDGRLPDLANSADEQRIASGWRGRLIAWDPVRQREVWTHEYPTIWNGGLLSTGGNLTFQGTADGRLVAYRASDGKQLWDYWVRTGVMAPPITYRVKGVQYVAVAAGWGGIFPLIYGVLAKRAEVQTDARILVFKLGGTARLQGAVGRPERQLVALPVSGTPADIAAGALTYAINCSACHGAGAIAGGSTPPDLRTISRETHDNFAAVLKGALTSVGMPNFSGKLTDAEIAQVRAYLVSRNAALRQERGTR